jgi:phospholipase D1/2
VGGRRGPAWGRIVAVSISGIALFALWRYTPLADYLTAERLAGWARAVRGTWWASPVLILAYTPAAILMFPRPLLTLVAIIAFGTWLGIAYSAAGIMLAAMLSYYAGRLMGQRRVERIAGNALDSAKRVLRRHAVVATFALNMAPVPPFIVQGLIAGAWRVNAWQYAIGSALGMAPSLFIWTIFGRQASAWLEDPSSMSWGIVAAAVALLALFTLLVRRWFAKQQAQAA